LRAFEINLIRRRYGPKNEKYEEDGVRYIRRSFVIFARHLGD
jgi:hypothetical protein